MARMKVTIVGYYDADPAHYGSNTSPAEMAAVDQKAFNEDPMDALASIDAISVEVEPQ
jgi:hypothetical protein